MTDEAQLRRIEGFRLVSADPERLARFYVALGFEAGPAAAIPAGEMACLGLVGGGRRLPLHLGPSRIDLDGFEQAGRAYPDGATSCDLVFQHLALVTDDAEAAWARARAAGATPISRDGAVKLPASSGGVTAAKLRDPEGHPLEFLQFPEGSNPDWTGRGPMGIDHSAISVGRLDASLAFYTAAGLACGKHTLNQGPTQADLDGLDAPVVDVQPLEPPQGAPPHLELLAYRTPRGRPAPALKPNDVAATRILWRADRAGLVRDPDGHLHELTTG